MFLAFFLIIFFSNLYQNFILVQVIAETLADETAELGSRQNLSNDKYSELYDLTTDAELLATAIVDSFTDLSDLAEDDGQQTSLTSRLMKPMAKELKDLELMFKPAFEHFQNLHGQVMQRQRVALSVRNSMAPMVCVMGSTLEPGIFLFFLLFLFHLVPR